ncbi:TadE/TadG family type IV pilus assembly protein [Sphingomonas sp. 1P06PA]|uniref:TadE/TadG family type IV pilus assembly protein n=1 Tax=Sphingomonas sp. 1P06PA TaxID=554121 RepID=UPI0039A7270A
MAHRLRQLARDTRGITIVEFALVAPVLLMTVLGSLELGHTMYAQTVLDGQLQKAARDMALEGSASATRRAVVEGEVRRRIRQISHEARIDFTQTAFYNYTKARNRAEEMVRDANADGVCQAGDTFVDYNRNGIRDTDTGVRGRGGAKDVVLYEARVAYPRLGLGRMFGYSDTVTLHAKTLLRNQPSELQAEPLNGTCA